MKFPNYSLMVISGALSGNLYSQIPTEVPKPQDNPPVDFSEPVNIVLFIVLPIIAIVLVIIWLQKRRSEKTIQK